MCASSFAIPQVRNKVRDKVESKVRDILYGDLESSDSEVDKVEELSETESEEVAGQESTILVSAEEEYEREKRKRENIIAERERISYRAFLSELQKSKTQEEETPAES